MKLLIFFVFSHYESACKYGIIFQISIYGSRIAFFLIPDVTIPSKSKAIIEA